MKPPLLSCGRCGQLAIVDRWGIRCPCTPARSASEMRLAAAAKEAEKKASGMTTKRPMPRTRTAIRNRIHCVLLDFHPTMAGSSINVTGRSAIVGPYLDFTEQQYRDALSRLPWEVRIVRQGSGLRVEPAPEISDEALQEIDEDSRFERASDWSGTETGGDEP